MNCGFDVLPNKFPDVIDAFNTRIGKNECVVFDIFLYLYDKLWNLGAMFSDKL